MARLRTVCWIVCLSFVVNCSKNDEVTPLPSLLISDLVLDQPYYIISNLPMFNISGTLTFSGAKGGIKTLRVTSDLGLDESVSVTGVSEESGQLVGVFTLQMITTPGKYSFNVWVIDGKQRMSNKLNGFFEMIVDPNKRPTAVQLTSVTWDANTNAPRLTWTKNNDDDFAEYTVTRQFPVIGRFGAEESSVVARVFDRNVTSITDPEIGAVGFNYSYNVAVLNQKVFDREQ